MTCAYCGSTNLHKPVYTGSLILHKCKRYNCWRVTVEKAEGAE